MSLLPGFQKELIASHLSAPDWQDAIRQVGALLVEHDFVQPAYVDAVIERERICATGLPTNPIGVAIPHAGVDHVHRTGIAVGVFSRPVRFQMMGSPELAADASIVFMIAMREPEQQVDVLKGLTDLFRRKDLLQEITRAASPGEVAGLLNEEA